MKLYAHEHTRKSDGEKFISYSARGKDGKWYNVKFAKIVKDKIVEEGDGIIDELIITKDNMFTPKDVDFPTVIITGYEKIIFKEKEGLPF